MNHVIEAKRSSGIDDLIRQFNITSPEQVKKPISEPSSRIQLLLDIYKRYLTEERFYIGGTAGLKDGNFKSEALDCLHIAPTPAEINIFVQSWPKIQETSHHYPLFSAFMTRIIQNSYDKGYNDFVIAPNEVHDIDWDGFGFELKGTPERPLQVELHADVNSQFMNCAEYVHAKLYGSAKERFGSSIAYCILEATGHIELGAESAEESTFIVNTFSPSDEWADGVDVPKGCTFKTRNKQTADSLNENLPSGNQIIYIQKGGKEKIMRDYDD